MITLRNELHLWSEVGDGDEGNDGFVPRGEMTDERWGDPEDALIALLDGGDPDDNQLGFLAEQRLNNAEGWFQPEVTKAPKDEVTITPIMTDQIVAEAAAPENESEHEAPALADEIENGVDALELKLLLATPRGGRRVERERRKRMGRSCMHSTHYIMHNCGRKPRRTKPWQYRRATFCFATT